MDAKEYLKNFQKTKDKIKQLKEQIREVEQLLYPAGIDYTRDRVQTSHNEKMSETVAQLIDLQKKLNKDVADYENKKYKIIKEIQNISDERYIKILYGRYVKGMTFEDIAEEIGYSREHIIRAIHPDALIAFQIANPLTVEDKNALDS